MVRVGAAAVVRRRDGRLLMGRRSVRVGRGMWVFPGGGIKFGERSRETVIREFKEETGLAIKPTKLITVYEMLVPHHGVHRIIFFYMAKVVGGRERPSEDIDRMEWMTPEEITKLKRLGDSTLDVLRASGLLKTGG